MKILAATWLCLAGCAPVWAEPVTSSAASAGVAHAVQRYANAIACNGVTVMPADVLTLSSGYEGAFAARYAVLWVGDMRCAGAGGPGSERTQLAIVTYSAGQYLVQPELSSPVVAFESPVRVVTRIVSHNGRNLVLEGKEFGPEDPPRTPSVPVRFILRVDGTGNWKLVDKVFLHSGAD